MTRRTYHHGNLETELVAYAFEEIRAHGAQKFSLRAAARHAGVDPSSVYRHFANKDRVLVRIACMAFSMLAHDMENAIAQVQDPQAQLRATGQAYLHFAQTEPWLFRVAFSQSAYCDEIRGEDSQGRSPYELLQHCLAAMAQQQNLRGSKEQAAVSAWCALHGLANLSLGGNLSPETTAATFAHLLDTLLAGLRAS